MQLRPHITFVSTAVDIQSAIDALPVGGGTVYVSRGTYVLTTLTFPSDRPCRLVGEGAGITILSFAAQNKDLDLVKVRYSYSGLEDLTIVGNPVAGAGRGIVVGSTTHVVRDCHFRNIVVYNTPNEALSCLGTAELGGGYFTFLNTFENCVFRLNYSAGATSTGMVYIGAGCTTIRFVHCTFDTFKGSAISDFSGVAGGGNALEYCNIEGPADDAQHWVLLSTAMYPKVIGCWFENTTGFHGKYKVHMSNGCVGAVIKDCNFNCIESTPLCVASAQGGSGTQNEYGTSIVGLWVRINAATPTGATLMVFGTANETPAAHVVAGGGIIRGDTLARVAWSGTYVTETAGTLTYRATA